MDDASIYTVGGTVQANEAGIYIPRKADQEIAYSSHGNLLLLMF